MGGGRMCRKGKACGATCINRQMRCVLELGPLIQTGLKKATSIISKNAGDIFARNVQQNRAPSVPSDMKRELAALAPRQLERSPGNRTRTAPQVRRELQAKTSDKQREELKDELRKELKASKKDSLETLRSKAQWELNRIENGSLSDVRSY